MCTTGSSSMYLRASKIQKYPASRRGGRAAL